MFLTTAITLLHSTVSSPLPLTGFRQPTLTRVQVGLLSLARELKGDLDRIAAAADTGSSQGLHRLLQGEAGWGVCRITVWLSWWAGCSGRM